MASTPLPVPSYPEMFRTLKGLSSIKEVGGKKGLNPAALASLTLHNRHYPRQFLGRQEKLLVNGVSLVSPCQIQGWQVLSEPLVRGSFEGSFPDRQGN